MQLSPRCWCTLTVQLKLLQKPMRHSCPTGQVLGFLVKEAGQLTPNNDHAGNWFMSRYVVKG